MSSPFYISPEQHYQDKAEYARKGIGRGRPMVALEYEGGIVMLAENRSSGLREDQIEGLVGGDVTNQR